MKRILSLILSASMLTLAITLLFECVINHEYYPIMTVHAANRVDEQAKEIRWLIVTKPIVYAYDKTKLSDVGYELHETELYEMTDIVKSEDGSLWYEIKYKGSKKYILSTDIECFSQFLKKTNESKNEKYENEEYTKNMIPLGQYRLSFYAGDTETATGATPTVGRTIAVDPKVIPLHSHVYIKGMGEFVAEDTGGLIKGKRIDVFLSSAEECFERGIEYRDVYLIK